MRLARFNPHPPVGAGAIKHYATGTTPVHLVSILTRPWGRVQRQLLNRALRRNIAVSILTRPWGRVQRLYSNRRLAPLTVVSILTRPWGRVQLDRPRDMVRPRSVSILTRPWGRVQRDLENARERFPKRKCSSCQGVPCRALGG